YLPQGVVPAIAGQLARMGRVTGWTTREWPGPAEPGEERLVAQASPVLALHGPGSDHAGARTGGGPAVLEPRSVTKHFGRLRVLGEVSLEARRGEVVGIVGPNGAGKTTLLRCIADGRERSSGTVVVNGRRIDGLPPQNCVALGVSRKFQTPNIFEALT